MVIVGNYSIRLVEARSKEPFKEYLGPDGAIYAEVEPGLEYFVELEIVGGDPAAWSVFELTIDGKKLKYHSFHLKSDGKIYKGLWSRQQSIVTKRAFSFQCPSTDLKGCAANADAELMKVWTGQVKVDISQGIPTKQKRKTTVSADSIEAAASINPGHAMSITSMHKLVRSSQGSYTETTRLKSHGIVSYMRGKLLESETINYCTTLGLIHAGILVKPHIISIETTSPSLPRVKRKRPTPDKVQHSAQSDYDFYDLSVVPDDEDDIIVWIPARQR